MCGRFVLAKELNEVEELFEIDAVFSTFQSPNFNIAPTNRIPMFLDRPESRTKDGIGEGEVTRELHDARWGLVPDWAKEISGAPLINARIESVLEKPSFRDSVRSKRCAIPASGYYEWQLVEGGKVPHYIFPKDGLLAFAGIYSFWKDPTKAPTDPERWVLTVSTMTKDSAPELAGIHDRNPVFLSPDSLSSWLDPGLLANAELLEGVATESDLVASELVFHPVGSEVGSVRAHGEGLIRPRQT